MNAYLGLVCAQKADLYGRLQKGNLSAEELLGAMEIMNGLLDEGPCAGMSDLEQPVELTLLYLEEVEQVLKAGNSKDAVIYAAQLSGINDYFAESEKEDSAKVCTKIQEIVDALDADELLAEGLRNYTWECLQVAKMCNKDIGQPLMQLIKEDFPKYFRYCHHFLQKGLWAEEFLALCEERIDENVYDKGMGNHMGLKLKAGQVPVDMVVQYLDRYPLQGQKLIEICMDSPIIRWRLMAGKALLGWVEKLNKPLSQIAPDLYSKVMTLHIIEGYNIAKEQWSKLI